MDSADTLVNLIEEVRTKIACLEKDVDDIHHVKKSLKVTSSDVKEQIRDSISRHLEALRSREIWLLSQVELIQQGKEEVLLQKQAEIIEMLGSMKKLCTVIEQTVEEEKHGEVEVFEEQLSELLASVEKLSITPEETPHMFFNAQNLDLLESIQGFGHVDAGVEDEGQLATQTGIKSITPSNKRKFFSFEGPRNYCLQNGQKFPKSQYDQTTIPIEKWLNECKPCCDSECKLATEMGSFAKSFDLSELKWVLSSEAIHSPSVQDIFSGYFEEVRGSTLEKWIKPSEKLPEQPDSQVIGETYSKIVAMGNDSWLLYKQVKSERNFPENLGKIHQLEVSNAKWLRRSKTLEYLPQTSTGKAFSKIASTTMDQWLLPKKSSVKVEQLRCNNKSSCANCECASTKDLNSFDDTDSMSDADWLKVKEEDCVSIENLDSIFRFKSKIAEEECHYWLVGPAAESSFEEDRSGIKKYNLMLQAQPIEDWLHNSKGINRCKEIAHPNNMQYFLDSMPDDYNKWLFHPTISILSADTCKWLTQSSIECCKNCPKICSKGLFTLFNEMKEIGNDNWLKNSNGQ